MGMDAGMGRASEDRMARAEESEKYSSSHPLTLTLWFFILRLVSFVGDWMTPGIQEMVLHWTLLTYLPKYTTSLGLIYQPGWYCVTGRN